MTAAAESYPPPAREEAPRRGRGCRHAGPPAAAGHGGQAVLQCPRRRQAGTKLAGELAKVALGRSDVEAERRDWRFKDPAWTGNTG